MGSLTGHHIEMLRPYFEGKRLLIGFSQKKNSLATSQLLRSLLETIRPLCKELHFITHESSEDECSRNKKIFEKKDLCFFISDNFLSIAKIANGLCDDPLLESFLLPLKRIHLILLEDKKVLEHISMRTNLMALETQGWKIHTPHSPNVFTILADALIVDKDNLSKTLPSYDQSLEIEIRDDTYSNDQTAMIETFLWQLELQAPLRIELCLTNKSKAPLPLPPLFYKKKKKKLPVAKKITISISNQTRISEIKKELFSKILPSNVLKLHRPLVCSKKENN